MGKPYSSDLRLRVLNAIDGGMSKMQAHRTFKVSRSTLDDWLKLRQQQGNVLANTGYRRGVLPVIQDMAALEGFVSRHCGSTLAELARVWQQETGHKVSNVTMGKALRRLGWTRKKRVGSTKSETWTSEAPSWRS